MAANSSLNPLSLRRKGEGLAIEWNDGVRTFVSWRELRSSCPCASCLDKRNQPPNPFQVLSPQEVAAGAPEPLQMSPRGHYAYQIAWNDGHDTGIYSLELLRQISEPIADDGVKE